MASPQNDRSTLLFLTFIILLIGLTLSSPGHSQNLAQPLTQLIGGDIKSGEKFIVMIQFKNTGSSTWSKKTGFHLANANKEDWGISRVELPKQARIAPGETANFRFEATAPLKAGKQPFIWKMRQWSTFFGQATEQVDVKIIGYGGVPNSSEFIFQNVPDKMKVNQSYPVTLHFKNTGRAVWTPGQYFLSPATPQGDMDWMIDQIRLQNITRRGEFYTFRFNVQAPSEPGKYSFAWQLRHESATTFGDTSENITVTVTP